MTGLIKNEFQKAVSKAMVRFGQETGEALAQLSMNLNAAQKEVLWRKPVLYFKSV
jgi:hypothetical protein